MSIELTKDHLRLLELNEGFRGKPYQDTVGKWTIGFGRNLDAHPLTRDEGLFLSAGLLKGCWDQLVQKDPWVKGLDPVRQAALMDMVYNLGLNGWMNFRRARFALLEGDFEAAADHMEESLWFRQVGARGPRICGMIRTGLWPWYTDRSRSA